MRWEYDFWLRFVCYFLAMYGFCPWTIDSRGSSSSSISSIYVVIIISPPTRSDLLAVSTKTPKWPISFSSFRGPCWNGLDTWFIRDQRWINLYLLPSLENRGVIWTPLMGFYCSAIIRRDQIWKDDGLLVTKKKKKRKSSLFWLTIDCGLFGWQHLNPNVASHEWSFDFRQQQLWEENAYSFVVDDDDKMTRKCQQWLRVMVSMCHPWFSEKFAITNYQPTGRLNELEFFPCTVNCHVKLAYSCHYPSFYSLFANNFQSDFELGDIEQSWNGNDLNLESNHHLWYT